jgi:copper chaperone CopZ
MTIQSVSLQQTTLAIRGMTCIGCAATIERVIRVLPGVQLVQVDLAAKQAQVSYDSTLVGVSELAETVAKAGYTVDQGSPHLLQLPSTPNGVTSPWQRPILFSLLGMAGLMTLYLILVSLAEGWSHAVELLLEDAWLVGLITIGFGVQVGLYTYLKTVLHTAAHGTGALTGAGGGTSTAAMVACCAHHVTDVLPLLGLSAAATFLAEYRIPFMLVSLATNLIGIGMISFLIIRQRRCLAKCALKSQNMPSALPVRGSKVAK